MRARALDCMVDVAAILVFGVGVKCCVEDKRICAAR